MAEQADSNAQMPVRTLGHTGVQVSLIGLGGWHLGFKYLDEQLSIRIIRTAIDNGINFMDNCWDYNEGASEIRMGKGLRDGYRERVFLMTKIDGRTKQEAAKQLDESLRRMQTDRIDLVQHHEILRFEDPHRIFDEQGANAALIEARDAGKIRFIGFTGHKDPRIHLHMLEVAKENGFRDRIFDEQGANAALIEARDAGKIRFIGFTGHKDPRIHLHMLEVAKENGF